MAKQNKEENPVKELQVRRLNAGDTLKLMRLFVKAVGDFEEVKRLYSGVDIAAIRAAGVGAATKEAQLFGVSLIYKFLQGILVNAYAELTELLSDLCGMKRDEFLALPPTAIIRVIEQVSKQDSLSDFFVAASELLGGTPNLEKMGSPSTSKPLTQ